MSNEIVSLIKMFDRRAVIATCPKCGKQYRQRKGMQTCLHCKPGFVSRAAQAKQRRSKAL